MYTVTFYSYKGGVGRTLALANVAYTLATEGGKQRIVVADFDLEAPGIDTIAPFDTGKGTEKGGIVEYIAEYSKGLEPSPDALPSLLPYAQEVDGISNLVVIPAGRKDNKYQETLTCLNWENFYKVKQGYRFFEQFKRKIEQEFTPDYLLVDSRTGLADVAGITTHQLADLVVLVFNLNRQNLDGITRCYNSIISAARPRPIKILLVASPIPQGHLLDPTLLESRLEDAANSMPNVVKWSQLENDRIIQIPYHAALSLMDVSFVRTYPTEEISRIYRRIAETIQKSNPAEMKFLLERAFRYRDENRFEEAEEEFCTVIEQHPHNAEGHYLYGDFLMKRKDFKKAIVQLEEAYGLAGNNSRYLYALGTALAGVNRNEAALEKLEMAERIEPANGAILRAISHLLSKMGDSTRALEYWRKISETKPPASRLERLRPSQRFTAMSPGFLSSNLSLPKDFDRHGFLDRLEKALTFDYAAKAGLLESILDQSFSSQQIQELDELLRGQESELSDLLGDYFDLVQSKVKQGDLNDIGDEKDLKRLIESEKRTGANAFRLCLAMARMNKEDYRGAVDIVATTLKAPVPEFSQKELYRIWGDAIVKLIEQTEDVTTKIELLQEATGKYVEIIRIKPDDHAALNNWGNALADLAALHEGPEREALLKEAVEKYARALEIKPDKDEALYNWGTALADLAALHEGPEREALLKEAVEKHARAVEIKPDKDEALYNWGNALGKLAALREGPDREALLKEAVEKYARALEIKPDDHEALNNWGNALAKLAALREGPDREALLKEAGEKYARAVEIKPDMHEALYNWGTALADLAALREGPDREALLKEAVENYARAVEIKPDKDAALYNWGNALANLAALREGPDREALLKEAVEKYARAVEIKPDDHEALTNWGNALANLAALRDGPDREALLEEALGKYARGVEIMPDQHEALYNCGVPLGKLAHLYGGSQRIETLDAALEKAKRAEELVPGSGIYNMACAYALFGRKKSALAALKKAIDSNPKYIKMAAGDEDFRSLWEDKAFKKIVAT